MEVKANTERRRHENGDNEPGGEERKKKRVELTTRQSKLKYGVTLISKPKERRNWLCARSSGASCKLQRLIVVLRVAPITAHRHLIKGKDEWCHTMWRSKQDLARMAPNYACEKTFRAATADTGKTRLETLHALECRQQLPCGRKVEETICEMRFFPRLSTRSLEELFFCLFKFMNGVVVGVVAK
jgi:hypothetical protein